MLNEVPLVAIYQAKIIKLNGTFESKATCVRFHTTDGPQPPPPSVHTGPEEPHSCPEFDEAD